MANDDWMIDNTGGEFTPKKEEESVGSQIVGALGRTIQSLPDALAEQKPIIGRPLQALFNTDAYQARQAGYQMAKERLNEYMAGKDLRAQKLKNDTEAERIRGEQMQQDAATNLANLKAREAQAKTAEKRAKVALDAIPEEQALLQERRDQEIYNFKMSQAREGFWKTCADNGMFSNFSYDELENLKKQHPAEFKMFFEATTAFELFQDALSGDKNAEGLLDRWCRKNGLRYVKGSDGIPMLMKKGGREDGEDSPVLELTPDGLKSFYQSTQNPVVAEINARSGLTEQAVSGNPAKINLANNIKAVLPYCGNSFVKAGKLVESVMDDMKEKNPDTYDRSFAINNCVQALSDYRNGKPGAMQELFSCIAPNNNAPRGELAKLGISIVGDVDPTKINPEDIKNLMFRIDGKEGQVTFDELYDYLQENDVFGRRMQQRIGFLQEASLMSMMRNARSRQGMGRTTGKPSAPSATDAQDPQTPEERFNAGWLARGQELAKDNDVNIPLIFQKMHGNKGSEIKSEDELYRYFALAGEKAADAYEETGKYRDAHKAFADYLKEKGVPESLIPNLWAKDILTQEIPETRAKMEKLNREFMRSGIKPEAETTSKGDLVYRPPRRQENNRFQYRKEAEKLATLSAQYDALEKDNKESAAKEKARQKNRERILKKRKRGN